MADSRHISEILSTVMQNAAFTISGKWPKLAFFSQKQPFLGTKMISTLKIPKVPESPLVQSFSELRGTFWHMFQFMGVAEVGGEFFFKPQD